VTVIVIKIVPRWTKEAMQIQGITVILGPPLLNFTKGPGIWLTLGSYAHGFLIFR
jgi:hypothetical protein